MTLPQPTVLIIAGPTAVGKTAAAIRAARHLGAEIISADSRQCFRELTIGVARPAPEELAAVPHHFIATHSVTEPVTAATFEQYALQKAEALFQSNPFVVMTGGTGLYLRAFCTGLDAMPLIPEDVRAAVRKKYEEGGLAVLQESVRQADPQFYATGEIQNPQRLMRALEVVQATGKSILTFRSGQPVQRPFRIIKTVLEKPRPVLYAGINRRVDGMMEAGLLEEVRSLQPLKHLNALQTVGYRELFAFLEGTVSLEGAIEETKKNTRHYAKRQLTWFRKEEGYRWFSSEEDLMAFVQTMVGVR